MKRAFCMLLAAIFCAAALFPVSAYAADYEPGDTDMRISVDDTSWYVFTRDNILNNAELEELGITYEAMYDILHNNEAYMDAILLYEDGDYVELFVRKRALDSGIANLSNYENEEVLELAKELAKKYGAEEYSVYEGQYKFTRLEYFDSNYGYYICEYVTVVNRDNYTLTFQTPSPFTDWEYDEIQRIVDSIRFDVDTTIREEKPASFLDGIVVKTITGAVIGGITGLVIALAGKKKNPHKNDSPAPADTAEKD